MDHFESKKYVLKMLHFPNDKVCLQQVLELSIELLYVSVDQSAIKLKVYQTSSPVIKPGLPALAYVLAKLFI